MVLRDRRPPGALPPPGLLLRVLMSLLILTVAAACGPESGPATGPAASAPTTAPPEPPTTVDPHLSFISRAEVPAVGVFESPDAPEPKVTLQNPTPHGGPLVFLEKDQEGPPDWVHVYVPVRPNGSTGWIRASDVSGDSTRFRILVELAAHRLTVWNGDELFHEERVGVGTPTTPTPTGRYYLTVLAHSLPDQVPAYGAYFYALSAFSEVYPTFGIGNGEIGLHGTADPRDLGTDVSNGCIRMSNEGVTKLAQALPLGTPIEIVP
ncbi:MAG: L,D-transpeptidase [Actinomycetota bacterium]|nr:L,D-transpeptidase [Actinomycetota bacterium]